MLLCKLNKPVRQEPQNTWGRERQPGTSGRTGIYLYAKTHIESWAIETVVINRPPSLIISAHGSIGQSSKPLVTAEAVQAFSPGRL